MTIGIGGDWELEMSRKVTKMSRRKKANTNGYFLSFKMEGTEIAMVVDLEKAEEGVRLRNSNLRWGID